MISSPEKRFSAWAIQAGTAVDRKFTGKRSELKGAGLSESLARRVLHSGGPISDQGIRTLHALLSGILDEIPAVDELLGWAHEENGGRPVTPGPRRIPRAPKANVRSQFVSSPDAHFEGREELVDKLVERLRADVQDGPRQHGLHGLGGIGKTQIARRIASRLRDEFPTQVEVNVRGFSGGASMSHADALRHCVVVIGGAAVSIESNEIETLRASYLAQLREKSPVLILVDDAPDPTIVQLLDPPEGCFAIVTSRERMFSPTEWTSVDVLTAPEAARMAKRICSRIPDGFIATITRLCDYLPLAIANAALTLQVFTDLSVEEYIAELSDVRTRLASIDRAHSGSSRSVTATLTISYQRLSGNPDAQKVFRELSVFAGEFDKKAESEICVDPQSTQLRQLVRQGLVFHLPNTDRYRVHDLARIFAEGLPGTDHEQLRMRHAIYYLGTLRNLETKFQGPAELLPSVLNAFDLDWSNTQAAQSWAKNATGSEALEILLGFATSAPDLIDYRVQPRARIDWVRPALGSRHATKHDLALTKLRLGNAIAATGENRNEATNYLRASVQESKEHGFQALEILGTASLSRILIRRLKVQDASWVAEVSKLRNCAEQSRLNHPVLHVKVLGWLVQVYAQHPVVAQHGVKLARQALRAAAELDPARPSEVAAAMSRLGHAYEATGGKGVLVRGWLTRAIKLSAEWGDRAAESVSCGRLGKSLVEQDPQQAVEWIQKGLAINRRFVGDRWGEAGGMCALAQALENAGEAEAAVSAALDAAEIAYQIHEDYLVMNCCRFLSRCAGVNDPSLSDAAAAAYHKRSRFNPTSLIARIRKSIPT